MDSLKKFWLSVLLKLLSLSSLCCHEESSHHIKLPSCENQYSESCNTGENDITMEEMFKHGHMKPFGSHHPPDFIVEELPYMISPQDFYMNYVAKHKPVVIKGAVKYWPAYMKWTDEYLNATYGNKTFRMETRDDDKWNIPPDMALHEFLQQYNHSNRYLVDELLPDMRKDVILPLCLRCEEMSSFFFVSYFWMSTGGTSSSIHIDTDENLLCVIRGHKVVNMVSPIYSRYLYSDESRVLGVSDINPKAVDLEKYPNVMKVRYHTATVEEGDIVYIPQMWWHQVISRPQRQQAVALWWKSKPSVKQHGRKAIPLKDGATSGEKYSFGNVLAQYEMWVQNVSENVARLECKDQQKFMSEYRFETDKVENAPTTMGDGGHLEEEFGFDSDELTKMKRQRTDLVPCNFDYNNEISPCQYPPCLEDEDNLKCVRYTLDYCGLHDDRGCVIMLPLIMTKLTSSDYQTVQDMASMFETS